MHELKHETEQNAHGRTAGGKKNDLQAGEQGKLQRVGRAEYVRLHAQKQGGLSGDQGRTDAGNQSGVVHDAHAGNLHGKKEAVIGVPNRAEKAAAMPLIRMVFLSFSLR